MGLISPRLSVLGIPPVSSDFLQSIISAIISSARQAWRVGLLRNTSRCFTSYGDNYGDFYVETGQLCSYGRRYWSQVVHFFRDRDTSADIYWKLSSSLMQWVTSEASFIFEWSYGCVHICPISWHTWKFLRLFFIVLVALCSCILSRIIRRVFCLFALFSV